MLFSRSPCTYRKIRQLYNRSVTQCGFCCYAKPTVHIVNFTQTHYKISQKNYKKVFKKAKV